MTSANLPAVRPMRVPAVRTFPPPAAPVARQRRTLGWDGAIIVAVIVFLSAGALLGSVGIL